MYDIHPEIVHMGEFVHGDDAIRYDAIDFSANINPLGPPQEIISYIKSIDRSDFLKYPDSDASELREALSEVYGVSPEAIITGNGSMELLRLFCQVFLKKGYQSLIPVPTFSEYERMTILHGGKCVFIRMKEFNLDVSTVLDYITEKTKIIFICNPNNPTARYYHTITEILEETASKKVLICLDEAFIDFSDHSSVISLQHPHLFVLQSATKIFSIPALRCGYGFSDQSVIEYMNKAATPWNLNHFAQEAVKRVVGNSKFIQRTKEMMEREKSYLMTEMQRIPSLQVFPSHTNFFLIHTRECRAPDLKVMLLRKGILIRDCSNFRGLDDHYFRICVRTREDNHKLMEALRTLHEEEKL
ncbi:MAG: histidinol-phosphate aminotransferase family protein [Theionarchaea archaeon]|nr:histidinol-phosphate aminotransferase family protein [Theionarchaea archaeon]